MSLTFEDQRKIYFDDANGMRVALTEEVFIEPPHIMIFSIENEGGAYLDRDRARWLAGKLVEFAETGRLPAPMTPQEALVEIEVGDDDRDARRRAFEESEARKAEQVAEDFGRLSEKYKLEVARAIRAFEAYSQLPEI